MKNCGCMISVLCHRHFIANTMIAAAERLDRKTAAIAQARVDYLKAHGIIDRQGCLPHDLAAGWDAAMAWHENYRDSK